MFRKPSIALVAAAIALLAGCERPAGNASGGDSRASLQQSNAVRIAQTTDGSSGAIRDQSEIIHGRALGGAGGPEGAKGSPGATANQSDSPSESANPAGTGTPPTTDGDRKPGDPGDGRTATANKPGAPGSSRSGGPTN